MIRPDSVSRDASPTVSLDDFGFVGRVTSSGKPIADALVRLKGTATTTATDADGSFAFPASVNSVPTQAAASPLRITAWKEGHFIAGADAEKAPISISLTPHPVNDATDYSWVDPTPDESHEHHCGNCHQEIYDQWKASSHSHSFTGRHFRNVVDGTDWHGNSGTGWSLHDDHPHGAFVCDSCHGPTMPEDGLEITDVQRETSVPPSGVHCDYCHKIRDVSTDSLGLTHGRYAISLLRPAEGQLFFGPLDDVDRGDDVFSPVQGSSRFCAPCHEGTVFGVPVYTTYSEWLASPAARRGRQCQECHMKSTGTIFNVAPGHGGIDRDPRTLSSHSFLPGGRASMLRRCLRVTSESERCDDHFEINVTVTAHNVGHQVPTGFIDRHLILAVEAYDNHEGRLPASSGTQIPPPGGRFAGQAGRLFAKLLTDQAGHAPLPFWRPGATLKDTRLHPDQPTRCVFQFPSSSSTLR